MRRVAKSPLDGLGPLLGEDPLLGDIWLLTGSERVSASRLLLVATGGPLAERLRREAVPPGAELRVPMGPAAARAVVARSCGLELAVVLEGLSPSDVREVEAALDAPEATPAKQEPQVWDLAARRAAPLAAALAAAVVFWPAGACNSEVGGYFMDDKFMKSNPLVTSDALDWTRLWRTDYWGLEMFGEDTWTHKSFRPLVVLTYRWNYLLHGFNSGGFHLANVALHFLVSFHVWCFGSRVLFLPAPWNSLLAMLFALHPIHVESIMYIMGRADILCALVLLLAVEVYAGCASSSSGTSSVFMTRTAIAAMLVLVSGLCKETGFTFFGLLVGWDILGLVRPAARLRRVGCIVRIAVLLVGGGIACSARVWYTNGTRIDGMDPYSNPIAQEPDFVIRCMSYAVVHGVYVKLLVFPFYLCTDYSFDAVPLVTSLGDVRLLLPLAAYMTITLMLSIGLVHLRRRSSIARFQAEGALIGWAIFVLGFIPLTNVLFTVGTVVAERLLYIPSIGFLSAAVCLLQLAVNTQQFPRRGGAQSGFVWLAAALTLLWWGYLSHRRVTDWQSVQRIAGVDAITQPRSARAQLNFATALMYAKRHEEALPAYLRAVKADPLHRDCQPLHHAGQLLFYYQRFAEAERYLLQALLTPDIHAVVTHVEERVHDYGLALWHVDRHEEALEYFERAVRINGTLPKIHNNIACAGAIIASRRQPRDEQLLQRSVQAIARAVELDPGGALHWRNAAVVHIGMGNAQVALGAWDRFKKLEPEKAQEESPDGNIPRHCVWEYQFR